MNFFDSIHCGRGTNEERCNHCRNDPQGRRNLVELWDDVDDENFKCPWTGIAALNRAPDPTWRLQQMTLEALIGEAKGLEMTGKIQGLVRYVEGGRAEKSKCPECSKSKVANVIRRWLAEEEAKRGA